MAAAAMATTAGGYPLLPGTPVTAPASPATPPALSAPTGPSLTVGAAAAVALKWVDDAPPVAVDHYEKLLARLTLSLRSTLQSRWVFGSLID